MKIPQQHNEWQHILDPILTTQAPEAIFLLSHASGCYNYDSLFLCNTQTIEQPTAYLLFLVIDTDAKTCTQIQSNIENILQHIATVTCWCMPLATFNEQLKCGDYFVSTVFTKAERLYVAEDTAFIAPVVIIPMRFQSQWYQRAIEFYAGAELFIIRKQYALAAFQLHQCAEQAFTGIIYNTCSYRPSTHNLLLLYSTLAGFNHHYILFFQPHQTMKKTSFNCYSVLIKKAATQTSIQ